jgi:hypothetical protein
VTGEASEDIKALWANIDMNGSAPKDEESKEQLMMDNLKRTYHNAIGRLPYGIPSPELRDWEWTDLAAVLATGEKKHVEGGAEVTEIEGRWYFSDPEDSGTFLKEHGTKERKKETALAGVDRKALLARLEERFILGEISEDTYRELKVKYGQE